MINYAKINENNIVVDVIVLDPAYDDETAGKSFIKNECGIDGTWLKSSVERKNSAGIGMIYDPTLDAFITEQPYSSWTLNKENCMWEAPKPRPEGLGYVWNEESLDWVEVSFN